MTNYEKAEKVVYKDGVHDISNEQYHASAGISRSRLMLLDKSPYHFWYETLSGEAIQKPSTPAMDFGSAFHTLLLEPKLFDREYCIKPNLLKLPPAVLLKDVGREQFEQIKLARAGIANTNDAIMEQFLLESHSKIVLDTPQFEKLYKMTELVKRHDIVKTLLDDSVFEQSIYWTDEETGLQFKTRPDIWSDKMIVDLKTTADASSHGFTRSALSYGYYLQAGMAFEGCKAIGKPFEMFVILACEKEAPHVPAVFMMDDEALQFGIKQFASYKRKLKACFDSGEWPGYPVMELGLPKYATINEDE